MSVMKEPPPGDNYGDEPVHCSICNIETTMSKITAHPETGAPVCIPCFKMIAGEWGYGEHVKDLK